MLIKSWNLSDEFELQELVKSKEKKLGKVVL